MAKRPSRSSTRTRSAASNTDLATAQLEQVRRRLREVPKRRILEGKGAGTCVNCEGEMVETSTLEHHFVHPGREVVVTGLSGEKCMKCGQEWLDANSVASLIRYRQGQVVAFYRGKVTRVGGDSLGAYFPRDLAASMGLQGGVSTKMMILDENHILIEVVRMAYYPGCQFCGKPMKGTIQADDSRGIEMEGNRFQCPSCRKTGVYGAGTVWLPA
ncbi:MAG TPA: YgiT-type zinc finger protein [Thermoplasmata archaeon]|nr:YgiT-type zinc finger protein [Thermoplasmata archaeon]